MAAVESGVHYYTEEHEWMEFNDGVVTIGISDHAQESLGDLVFVGDLVSTGTKVAEGDVIAVVESVKATSDIFAPIGGIVEETNSAAEDSPETLNQDPEGDGWLIRMRVSQVPDDGELMDSEAYSNFCQG